MNDIISCDKAAHSHITYTRDFGFVNNLSKLKLNISSNKEDITDNKLRSKKQKKKSNATRVYPQGYLGIETKPVLVLNSSSNTLSFQPKPSQNFIPCLNSKQLKKSILSMSIRHDKDQDTLSLKKINRHKTDIHLNKHVDTEDTFSFAATLPPDKHSPQIPYEYLDDILTSLSESENRTLEFRIIPGFIDSQSEINEKMRAVVVSWLNEVHYRFRLQPSTLFLAVNMMDRYLSCKIILKVKLQLIAVTCLLIACKTEEILSPEVSDFTCILDKSYGQDDMLKCEKDILKLLKFEVNYPSSLLYFDILRVKYDFNTKDYYYGYYLLELSLLDCRFSRYSQALLACTVCYIILKLKEKADDISDQPSKCLFKYVKFTLSEIQACSVDLCFLVDNIISSNYKVIYEKYSSIRFEESSKRKIDTLN